jgi:hypothetical protein
MYCVKNSIKLYDKIKKLKDDIIYINYTSYSMVCVRKHWRILTVIFYTFVDNELIFLQLS